MRSSVAVHRLHSHADEIFSAGRENGPVGGEAQRGRFLRRPHEGGGNGFPFGVERDGLEFAGPVRNAFPDQPRRAGTFAAPLRNAVQEELDPVIIRVDVNRQEGLLPSGPVPVRKQMQHRLLRPACLVKVRPVLRQSGQVENSVVRAADRPVAVVGRRLSEVVEAGPDELAHDPRAGVLLFEFVIRRRRIGRMLEVAARALPVFADDPLGEERKIVPAARTEG